MGTHLQSITQVQDILPQAIEHAVIASCLIAPNGVITWSNSAFHALVERTGGSPQSFQWSELTGADESVGALMDEAFRGCREEFRFEGMLPRCDQPPVVLQLFGSAVRRGGDVVAVFVQAIEVTDEERQNIPSRQLARDDLTGLLNRSEILRRIERFNRESTFPSARTAVLFCDVDNFKEINDAFGHPVGDEVLRILSQRVTSAIRSSDFAARVGGDEILVALPGVHSLDEAIAIAEDLRDFASRRVNVNHGRSVSPTLSIGVTLDRGDEPVNVLIERADAAMYRAKESGRNRVVAVK